MRFSKEYRERMSKIKLAAESTSRGEHRPEWKGDDVSNAELHKWVRYHKTKTGVCQRCKRKRYTMWSNIEHRRKRNLDDFIELCVPCHWFIDGRRKNDPLDEL